MQFQVPQFIEVEDKIFGPLTLKQFIYVIGGAGLAFICYKYLPLLIAIPLGLAFLGFGLALAFYKINGKPFIVILEAAFKYASGNKLFIWKKTEKTITRKADNSSLPTETSVYVPKLSDSKLKDLTWSLDVKESLNPVTRSEK